MPITPAALRWAAYHGHVDVVYVLLTAGANPAVALENVIKEDRSDVAATLDACATVLSQEQRTELLAVSRPNEFIQLRAIAASTEKHRAVRR